MSKLANSLPKHCKKSIRDRVYAVVTLDRKEQYLGDYGATASMR